MHLGVQLRFEALAQAPVGADAARHDQVFACTSRQRPSALDQQGVHCRLLESPGDVGPVLIAQGLVRVHGVQGEGLQAAEAEVQAGAVGHRPRETEPFNVPVLGAGGDRWAAGIAEAQHFADLVEGFAHGVVQGFAEHLVVPDAGHLHQLGVASGHQQGDEGQRWLVGLHQRREQMRLHVMHANGRPAQAPSQGAAIGGAHQERAH